VANQRRTVPENEPHLQCGTTLRRPWTLRRRCARAATHRV